jgi:hypothetical protein
MNRDHKFLAAMKIQPCNFDDETESDIRAVTDGFSDGEAADIEEIMGELREARVASDKIEKTISRLHFECHCWRNFALVGWCVLVYELWRANAR